MNTPRRRQPETLLAGNASVSLGPDGTPTAVLSHPGGGSCRVALPGARVISWCSKDGVERLGPGSGLFPCGLDGLVGAGDWTIEAIGSDKDEVAFTAVAGPAQTKSGLTVLARASVALWPDQLRLSLEVSHVSADVDMSDEEEEDMAGSLEAKPKRPKVAELSLPGSGLAGSCRCSEAPGGFGQVDASTGVPLGSTGLHLQSSGFTALETSAVDGLLNFKILAPCLVSLRPGETASGSVTLAVKP